MMIWAVAAVPVVIALYFGLRPLFKRFIARQEEAEELAVAA
jgi:flagellar biosynthesis/type III secretory pathway M-ring protein FliF/YscJ